MCVYINKYTCVDVYTRISRWEVRVLVCYISITAIVMLLQFMAWLQWRQAVALLFRGDQVAAQRALTCHILEGEHASCPRTDL